MQRFLKYEKYLFWLLVFIHLYPVFALKLFPTLDGPTHLYNANLLFQIISDNNGFASQFFSLKSFPVPNYTGHVLLSFFNSFLTAWLAEKVLLCSIIIALPFSFRMLLRSHEQSALFADYLIFPFIYSYTFYLGFFNFSLGVALMLITFAYWLRTENNFHRKKVIALTLLFILLYFSHLLTFLFTGFIIGILVLWKSFIDYLSNSKVIKDKIRKQILTLLTATIPGLILAILFTLQKGEESKLIYLELSELVRWLKVVHPVITLQYEYMESKTRYIFYTLVILLIIIVFQRLNLYFRKKNPGIIFNDSWLLICMILIIFYFTFPNWMSSGGHISIRILFFFYLFIILWVGLQKINKFFIIIAAIIFLTISFIFLNYHYKQTKFLADGADEIYHAANFIEENSVVLPISNSDNWMHANFSSYLAVEKEGIIVLDNYEAGKAHFPLNWRKNKSPYGVIAPDFGRNLNACHDINEYEKASGHTVDYVFRWYYNPQSTNSCNIITNKFIAENYNLVYTSPSGKAEVFKKRSD